MNAGKLITGLLAFFLVCALVTSECMCAHVVDLGAPKFTVQNVGLVRCYPKTSGLSDDSTLRTYTWKWYTDGSAYYPEDTGYAAYLAGWPVVDTSPDSYTTGGCGSQGSGHVITDQRILAYVTYSTVQWDFSPLPASGVVISSVLHYRLKSVGVNDSGACYYAFPCSLGGVTMPGTTAGAYVVGDVSAGTSWVGGTYPFLTFASDITEDGALALVGPWPAPPDLMRDINSTFYMAWGLRSVGACAYIDVNYGIPCTVSGMDPDAVPTDGEWQEVLIEGAGFEAGCELSVDEDWEIAAYTVLSGSSIASSVRYVGDDE